MLKILRSDSFDFDNLKVDMTLGSDHEHLLIRQCVLLTHCHQDSDDRTLFIRQSEIRHKIRPSRYIEANGTWLLTMGTNGKPVEGGEGLGSKKVAREKALDVMVGIKGGMPDLS
jgi:hypothetical protein